MAKIITTTTVSLPVLRLKNPANSVRKRHFRQKMSNIKVSREEVLKNPLFFEKALFLELIFLFIYNNSLTYLTK